MARYGWMACFRRRAETEAPTQQLHTNGEQLPSYWESQNQNQEQICESTGQSPNNAEKSTADENANTEKEKNNQHASITKEELSSPAMEASKIEDKKWKTCELRWKVNTKRDDYLEALEKSELVEILNIARDRASDPSYEPLAPEFVVDAIGRHYKGCCPMSVDMLLRRLLRSVPVEESTQLGQVEKSTQLGRVELLRVARITPYEKLTKSELMGLYNSDLVELLREAQKEHSKQHLQPYKTQTMDPKERETYVKRDQSSYNPEKSKDQKIGAEKGASSQIIIKKMKPKTKALEEDVRFFYSCLLLDISRVSNETLDKLSKSDLVELLDVAREEVIMRPTPNIAEKLDAARGESLKLTTQSTKICKIPLEKLSELGLVELLSASRVTPYHMIPKSELMRIPNSELVDLLREARSKYFESFEKITVLDYTMTHSRHVQRNESYGLPEATQQETNNASPSLPSATELELKGLKDTLDKMQLESNNRLDRVQEQLKAMKADLVKGKYADCENATAESDTATDGSTESTNPTDTSSPIDQNDESLKEAKKQARRELAAVEVKCYELYTLMNTLKTDSAQNKTFGTHAFENYKANIADLGRDIDVKVAWARKEVALLYLRLLLGVWWSTCCQASFVGR